MTAPVISFNSSWVTGDLMPSIDAMFTGLTIGDTISFKWGRVANFSTYDGIVSNIVDDPELFNLASLMSGPVLYNGHNYYRICHNGECSNILSDSIMSSINSPSAWTFTTSKT